MAKKFRCPRPINRLVMHRARGLSGPMAQNIGGGRCMIAPGQFWGPGGPGGGGSTLAFSAAVMDPVTGEMLLQDVGTGTPTTTHTATIYRDGHEGVYRPFAANVPVWQGGRVVTNYIKNSDDLTQTGWATVGTASVDNADTITLTSSLSQVYQNTPLIPGGTANKSFVVSVDLWVDSGSTDVQISNTHTGVSANYQLVSLTTTPKRFAYAVTNGAAAGTGVQSFGIRNPDATVRTVRVSRVMLEESTGRSDTTTPSEYIPTTTAAATKTFGTENGNSVVSNVVTEAKGADLAQKPRIVGQPLGTNSQKYSNDLTNAEWTASNVTVAKDETGIDGTANGACTLTATAGNGTVIANAITAASANHATAWHIKRKTGTGNVDVTLDNGATWTTLTLTADFQRLIDDQAALTNPQIGIRIVTSGDAVIVGNAECHLTKTIAEVRGLGPIFTTAAAASTDALVPEYDIANIQTDGVIYLEIEETRAFSEATKGDNILSAGANAAFLFTNLTGKLFGSYDGNTTVSLNHEYAVGDKIKCAVVYSETDGLFTIYVDGVQGSEQSFVAAWNTITDLRFAYARSSALGCRDVRIYSISSYAAGKTLVEGLMA